VSDDDIKDSREGHEKISALLDEMVKTSTEKNQRIIAYALQATLMYLKDVNEWSSETLNRVIDIEDTLKRLADSKGI